MTARSICQEYGVGLYYSGEGHAISAPWNYKLGSHRACLFADGFSQQAVQSIGAGASNPPTANSAAHIVQGIDKAGLGVMTGDLGNSQWGNATGISRMGSLHTYAKSRIYNSNTVVLAGVSMGAANVLNWAKANPTYPAAIALFCPALDMQDIWDNDRANLKAWITAAYGGRPPDASNPADNAASFSSIPICIWYSSTDTVILPAIVEAFAAAVGSNVELRDLGTGGHDVSPVDGLEAGKWLKRYI